MNWIYAIRNKMLAALLLFGVVVMVLLNNFAERDNSAKINKAIDSIYDDRLIAERYIFQYLENTQRIIEIIDDDHLAPGSKRQVMMPIFAENETLDAAYLQTTLTELESFDFQRMQALFGDMERAAAREDLAHTRQLAKEVLQVLSALSELQVSEAQDQMSAIKRLNSSTTLYFQFEVAVLVIIGIIIQALVFASKTLQVNPPMDRRSLLN